MHDEYIYAVTRIHTEEHHLLNGQDMERLFLAQNVAECFCILADKGWSTASIPADNPVALLNYEEEKTWALIRELMENLSPLDVLLQSNNFHNLKAAIKLVYMGQDRGNTDRYFQQPGTVDTKVILQAVQRHDFGELPLAMAEAGRNAYEVLIRSADSQACDIIIDYAALLAIDDAASHSESDLLHFYATLKADTANIKAAVRACRMGKDKAFLERVIAPVGSLNRQFLIDAAAESFEEICNYLSNTEYIGAIEPLHDSLTAFECWLDNRLMESIRPQRDQYFTVEPIVAYILGRENEIAMVRLLLTAKLNRLDGAFVRKRWRQMYV